MATLSEAAAGAAAAQPAGADDGAPPPVQPTGAKGGGKGAIAPTTTPSSRTSSGGGAALVRLLAAAFSAGSEGASGPSPRIAAGFDDDGDGGSNGGGLASAAAHGRSRTPPLVSEAAPPVAVAPSAGGAGSLGGASAETAAAAAAGTIEPRHPPQTQPPKALPFWRLGAPPEGRGARVERHGPGPAGGVPVPNGPWGVRGEPGGPEPASLDYFPRTGVRTFTDGVQGPSTKATRGAGADDDALTPLGRAVAVLTLLGYVGWGHCLLALMFTCAFTRSPYAFLLLALAIGSLFIPAAPLYVRALHLGPLMRCWRRYFRFSYAFEARLDASRPYVVAQFPHGAFPLGQIVGGSFMACEFEQHTLLGLAASAVFLVPGWRHVNSWFGALPATSHNFRRLLRRCARAARGELLAEAERAETEAIEAGAREAAQAAAAQAEQEAAEAEAAARAASAEAEAVAAASKEAEVAAAAEAALAKARAKQQQKQQQQQEGATPSPTKQRRSPSPHRRAGAGAGVLASASRPTSAPPSGPFSSPGAARPLLSDLLHTVPGVCAAAAAPTAAARPLEATISAPPAAHHLLPLRSADAERAAMLARLRRADSILSDPGARALAGRGLSDDESDSGSSGGSSSGGSSRGASRAGSEELSSDPSVILVGASPAAVLEEDGEGEEGGEEGQMQVVEGAAGEQQQQQQQLGGVSAAGLRRRRTAAAAASYGGGNGNGSDPEKLRPGSPAPGSPRAADPAAPDTPRAPLSPREQRPTTGGRAATTAGGASSRPGTGGHHHHHHHPAPVPQNLLPTVCPDGGVEGHGPYPKHRFPGTSVAVMVGGIAEMFMLRKDAEVLKLRSRKGFVRLALEHGTDILPTYLFGNSAILDFGPRWLQQASRRWRASFGLMYGPWGLPLPRRVPILMVVGAPVKAGPAMAPTDPGFEARVDEIHANVCLEIARVYYRWRAEYGWADRPLIIA
jgi:hypothetical protein